MTSKQIREWAAETTEHEVDPMRLQVRQAQATFELAAQVAQFREVIEDLMKEVISDGCIDVFNRQ